MNLVGKILVFMILGMTLVFMGLSVAVFATHKSWMEAINRPQDKVSANLPLGYKYKLQDAEARNKELTEKLAALTEEVAKEKKAKDEQIAKLATERDKLKTDNTQLTAQQTQLQDDHRTQVAALTKAQATLDEKMKMVDSLRTDIAAAQTERDDKFKALTELQDKFNTERIKAEQLEESSKRLAGQLGQAMNVLQHHDLKLETPTDGIPPKVDGIVLASGNNGMVEISLGSDDGLSRGNTLEVFRHKDYLGRIEVLQTEPDRAVAKVIPGFQKGKIQRDDRVATRLQ